jgi:ubiquinone/menaquinone biosynthesis C-methylase UbiE
MATTSIDLQSAAAESEKSRQAWSEHWAEDKQQSVSQRFFSFYRKAVFARAVRYYVNRYFPKEGILIEAGSGTAETSMRIDKCGGKRKLVATDIVQPVLKHCHPVMDERVCGDIFSLPFADDSVDGIWNVGVMEHFTQEQIDKILGEFYRVLKPGHRIILLIPGEDSPPQKILRLLEKVINARSKEKNFSFHPPEISQIKSKKQGFEMMERNGFENLYYDFGWRSLLAFKTLVAVKK